MAMVSLTILVKMFFLFRKTIYTYRFFDVKCFLLLHHKVHIALVQLQEGDQIME